MPTLIKLAKGEYRTVSDPFAAPAEDQAIPAAGPVLLSLARFQIEGASLLDEGRILGVRVEPDQRVEDLAYDLHRLALVALVFPKFRDGRAYSAAALLRQRYRFRGEVRAVGEVLREQAFEMVRCGFDGFAAVDGATAPDWARSAGSFRHVYQAAADGRAPAFAERRR